MRSLDLKEVEQWVEANIGDFHKARLDGLQSLKLRDVLARKNPYLFKAKNILTAGDFIETIIDAHLSSQEETIFGDFLEQMAVFVCSRVYGGRKSSTTGIDLEFERDGAIFLVAIKSGPHWANSEQLKRLKTSFETAMKTLRTSRSGLLNIQAINGCCYGKGDIDKGVYRKLCGQKFWELISGDSELYLKIVEPLGHKAKEKNEEFLESYAIVVNKFTMEFANEYCQDGVIDWAKVVRFNSGAVEKAPKSLPAPLPPEAQLT